jgi:hypothetical protein
MKKILLLNAPPGAGKDHAGEFIAASFEGAKVDKFARTLKEATHALYGWSWKPHDYYELVKEIPTDDFYGLTPRQAYINVSEVYFKKIHGVDIFGKILSKNIKKYNWDLLVITDAGFLEEALVLIEEYGEENIILVRVHREGHTFKKDSRDYIDFGSSICTTDIVNDGGNYYLEQIEDIVSSIYNYAN